MNKYQAMEIIFEDGFYKVKRVLKNGEISITPWGAETKGTALDYINSIMGSDYVRNMNKEGN